MSDSKNNIGKDIVATVRERMAKQKYKSPCVQCGSWYLIVQTPIVIDNLVDEDFDDAKKLLKKYIQVHANGDPMLQGPCFIMCKTCGHAGPAVDCTGRTSADVGQDREVFAEMIRLWQTDSKESKGEDERQKSSGE